MPRVLRTELADGFFHVNARAVAETPLYRDSEDCRIFLQLLTQVIRRFDWRCYALCLMTTHYHLVLESTCAALSLGLQRLNGLYAICFNRRYERKGHLFGGRFWTSLIESEEHLHQACEYVLQNPVRAGLCDRPADWPWSACRSGFGAG
jgi:REP element-mobilizing transposase RayT